MNELTLLSEVKDHVATNPVSLLFIKMANCGVCDATLEKTVDLLQAYPEIAAGMVSIEQMPSLSGEWLVFTAPTILLFVDGKEVHRQSRIVVFGELENALRRAKRVPPK
ncbi:thioredoxin family protein [Brevibacillus panacihumi]|uniref:Thioredoxin n=1 Tax=Brevibacillus panacihumi TaxID=497735 RepID=A0A3M8CN84_9BACL|nr:thioredoxin family protein [Brevibacillus panacihumi]RNB77184.1 thioredoxin [Brevibacillus panacihumi]